MADDAFGLKPHKKPYPNENLPIDQRILNYRLSRPKRVVENTSGIATSRFTVFRIPLIAKTEIDNKIRCCPAQLFDEETYTE